MSKRRRTLPQQTAEAVGTRADRLADDFAREQVKALEICKLKSVQALLATMRAEEPVVVADGALRHLIAAGSTDGRVDTFGCRARRRPIGPFPSAGTGCVPALSNPYQMPFTFNAQVSAARSGTARLASGAMLALTAACGGGGGSATATAPSPSTPATSPTTPTTPGTPTASTYSADLVTAVSAPTYASGSAERGAWTVLQDERGACGFGLLQQDTRLDQADKAHADYMANLSTSTGTFYIGHGETAGTAGYTGGNALSRATAAGWPSGSVTEVLDASSSLRPSTIADAFATNEAQGAKSMRTLMASVYHLSGAMAPGRFVGFGSAHKRAAYAAAAGYDLEVYEFGALVGTISNPQSLGSGTVATYPCAGATHVSGTFAPALESPNPFPDVTSATTTYGTPIYVKVDAGHVLSVTSSTLTASNGTSIPTRSIAGASDTTGELGAHEAFIVPTQALVVGRTYAVVVAGMVDGVAFAKSFSFSVAA